MLSLAEPVTTPSSRLPDVVIELPGEPKGKGRPRFTKKGFAYTPEETRSYEGALRWTAAQAMGGRAPFHHALKIRVIAIMSVPSSWSNKRRAAALTGLIRPVVRPDLDNILKAPLDAFNRVVWQDDNLIVECSVEKHYGDRPSLRVEVWQHVGLL